jgi:hypothetical protein
MLDLVIAADKMNVGLSHLSLLASDAVDRPVRSQKKPFAGNGVPLISCSPIERAL